MLGRKEKSSTAFPKSEQASTTSERLSPPPVAPESRTGTQFRWTSRARSLLHNCMGNLQPDNKRGISHSSVRRLSSGDSFLESQKRSLRGSKTLYTSQTLKIHPLLYAPGIRKKTSEIDHTDRPHRHCCSRLALILTPSIRAP